MGSELSILLRAHSEVYGVFVKVLGDGGHVERVASPTLRKPVRTLLEGVAEVLVQAVAVEEMAAGSIVNRKIFFDGELADGTGGGRC